MAWDRYKYRMFGHVPLASADIERVLGSFSEAGVPAAKWGILDGAVRQAVEEHSEVARSAETHGTVLWRTKAAPVFDVQVELRGFVTFMTCEAQGDAGGCTRLHELFREIVRRLPVDYGVFGGIGGTEVVFDGVAPEQERALRTVTGVAMQSAAQYRQEGPAGVALSTYFGEHFVEQFGPQLLQAAPCKIEEIEKGYLLSLSDEPCSLKLVEVADRWSDLMRHLAPAGMFARQQANGRWTRGERCRMVYGPKASRT